MFGKKKIIVDEETEEILDNVVEINKRIYDGKRNLSDILDDYAELRELLQELLEKGFDPDNINTEALKFHIETINDNIPSMVNNVYNNLQTQIGKTKSLEEKLEYLEEARDFLAPLLRFPEHMDHPYLVKAVNQINDYESK